MGIDGAEKAKSATQIEENNKIDGNALAENARHYEIHEMQKQLNYFKETRNDNELDVEINEIEMQLVEICEENEADTIDGEHEVVRDERKPYRTA